MLEPYNFQLFCPFSFIYSWNHGFWLVVGMLLYLNSYVTLISDYRLKSYVIWGHIIRRYNENVYMVKALALSCELASFSLQLYIKEDALVKFKSELAVIEHEVQVKICCHLLTFFLCFFFLNKIVDHISLLHISWLTQTCTFYVVFVKASIILN